MKASFSLCLAILVGHVAELADAYAVRGAAERALYYMAYLAEEETPELGYTIAPGCTGTDNTPDSTRCSLQEFLLHIWAPEDTDEKKPTEPKPTEPKPTEPKPTEPKPTGWKTRPYNFKVDASQQSIDSLISNLDKRITGKTDSARLKPGGGDYFRILGDMGEPINMMITAKGENLTDKQRLIVAKAKAATEAIVGLRWMDMEKYRLPYMRRALQTTLGDAAIVETTTWRTGFQGNPVQLDADRNAIPNTKGVLFNTLDVPATILANGPRSANAVIQQARTYAFHDENTIKHFAAISAGQRAAVSLGCALPGGSL